MKVFYRIILILLTLSLLVCANALAGSLYAVKQVEEDVVLVRIDTESLEAQEVGPLYLPIRPAPHSTSGMAWDPHSQTLYYALHSVLMTIDLHTLAVIYWDTVEINLLSGLAYDCTNAELYGVSAYTGGFYSIDTKNRTTKSIPYTPGDDQNFTGLTYNQVQDILVGLKGQEGDLYLLEWRTGGDSSLLYDNPQTGKDTNSLAYDVDQNLYWSVNRDGELYSYDPANDFQLTLRQSGLGYLRSLVYVHDNPCEPPPIPPIPINYGLTDAWFDPVTAGQGFLITVFPEIKRMFVAWFTYDTERPPEDVTAILAEPGHRWLTAQGPYVEGAANLTIYVTEGGVFDAAEPAASTDPVGDGTMTVGFTSCNSGSISYNIPSISRMGDIPIERIVLDKVPLCEQLEQFAK